MAFPTNPTNGEQYTNALGTIYQYSSADGIWTIVLSETQGVTGLQGFGGVTGLRGETGVSGNVGSPGQSGNPQQIKRTLSLPANGHPILFQNITGLYFFSAPSGIYSLEYRSYLASDGSYVNYALGYTGSVSATGMIIGPQGTAALNGTVVISSGFSLTRLTVLRTGTGSTGLHQLLWRNGSGTLYESSHIIVDNIL